MSRLGGLGRQQRAATRRKLAASDLIECSFPASSAPGPVSAAKIKLSIETIDDGQCWLSFLVLGWAGARAAPWRGSHD